MPLRSSAAASRAQTSGRLCGFLAPWPLMPAYAVVMLSEAKHPSGGGILRSLRSFRMTDGHPWPRSDGLVSCGACFGEPLRAQVFPVGIQGLDECDLLSPQ